MKKRLALLLALGCLLALPACNGAAEESAPTEESFRSVYTDWSKLEPYTVEENYTRWYDGPVDRLLAVEGGYGGPLIGFCGERQLGALDFGFRSEISRYGLATADGTVVCDPVYEGASHPSVYDPEQGRYVESGDFLLLTRTFFDGEYDPAYYWLGEYRYTVAAGDGSWVLPGEYRRAWSMSDGRLLLEDTAGDLWFCGQDGTVTASPLTDTFAQRAEEADWAEVMSSWRGFYDGVGVFRDWEQEGSWLLNAVTGEAKYLPDVAGCYGWPTGDRWAVAYKEKPSDYQYGYEYGYLDRNGDWAIPLQFRQAGEFVGECAQVELDEEEALIDRSGQVVVCAQGHLYQAEDRNGSIYCLDWIEDGRSEGIMAVYDEAGQLVPDHPLVGWTAELKSGVYNEAVEELRYGAVATKENKVMTLWDYDGTVLGTVEDAVYLSLERCENGRAVLFKNMGVYTSRGLYDVEAGEWIVPLNKYGQVHTAADGTDTVYAAYVNDGGGYDILREDGTFLAHVEQFLDFTQGRIQAVNGEDSIWLDLNGEEVFRWRIRTNSD